MKLAGQLRNGVTWSHLIGDPRHTSSETDGSSGYVTTIANREGREEVSKSSIL